MSKCKVLKATLTNFASFAGETSFSFGERNLVLGENKSSKGANSNGSGKSNFLNSVAWALYGEQVYPGLKANHIIHQGEKSCSVELWIQIGRLQYKVVRKRTNTSGTLEVFLIRPESGLEECLSPKGYKESQKHLEALLGSNWDVFKTVAFFVQGDVYRFASPFLKESQRKEIFKEILGLEVWEVALKNTKKLVQDLADMILELKRKKSKLKDDKHELALKMSFLEGSKTKDVEHTLKKIDSLKSDIQDFELIAEDLAVKVCDCKEKLKRIALHDAIKHRKRIEREHVKLRQRIEIATENLSALLDCGECWVCGGDPKDACLSLDEKLAILHSAEKTMLGELHVSTSLEAELTKKAQAFVDQIDELQNNFKLNKLQKARTEKEVEDLMMDLSRAKAIEAKRVSETKGLRAEIRSLEVLQLDLEKLLFSHERSLNHLNFWKNKGFGKKGISNLAIMKALPVLNKYTNSYLTELTEGKILARWEISKSETSSNWGLALHTTVDGVEDRKLSGGQQRRLELATEMALREIHKLFNPVHFDFVFIDEPFYGLDFEGVERVSEWVSKADCGMIALISHMEVPRELFSTLYEIKKNDKVSEVVMSVH